MNEYSADRRELCSSPSSRSIAFQRFNVTVEGAVVLQVESNITRALSKVFYDLSGCRVSGKVDLNGTLQKNILGASVLNLILYSVSVTDEALCMIVSSQDPLMWSPMAMKNTCWKPASTVPAML